jgi:hypothetical protein
MVTSSFRVVAGGTPLPLESRPQNNQPRTTTTGKSDPLYALPLQQTAEPFSLSMLVVTVIRPLACLAVRA